MIWTNTSKNYRYVDEMSNRNIKSYKINNSKSKIKGKRYHRNKLSSKTTNRRLAPFCPKHSLPHDFSQAHTTTLSMVFSLCSQRGGKWGTGLYREEIRNRKDWEHKGSPILLGRFLLEDQKEITITTINLSWRGRAWVRGNPRLPSIIFSSFSVLPLFNSIYLFVSIILAWNRRSRRPKVAPSKEKPER